MPDLSQQIVEVLQRRFDEFYWGEDDEDDGDEGLTEEHMIECAKRSTGACETAVKLVVDQLVEQGRLERRKRLLIPQGPKYSIA